MNSANIGGEPARFKPFIDLYRKTGLTAGHAAEDLKVAIPGLPFAKVAQAIELLTGDVLPIVRRALD